MIFGHTCNVKSKPALKIENDVYAHFQEVVLSEAFLNASIIARNQLYGRDYQVDQRVFQEEFSLPMKRNLFGLLTIPITIQQKNYQFIIDTGAQVSGIKEELAKRLHLTKSHGSVSIGSIGGKQKTMPGVMVNRLQLGAIEYHNLPMIQLSSSDFSMRFGNIDLFRFDGIIGWDILRQLDFEIDDIKKTFIVLKNRLKITNPNMIMGSFPCFIVQLANGSHAVYGFDSGSKVSWIGKEAIKQHGYTIAGETTSLGFGVHGMEKLPMQVVEHVQILLDKAQIDLHHTMSGRTDLFPAFTFDGVLGNEICKGRRMRMINSKGMILIA